MSYDSWTADELYLAECFVDEVLRKKESFSGLTVQESKFVRALKAAHGRVVPHTTMSDIVSSRPGHPVDLGYTRVLKSLISQKRPDIFRCIHTAWGEGYYWREPDEVS